MKKQTGLLSLLKKLKQEERYSARSLIAFSLLSLFIISFSWFIFFQRGLFFFKEHSSLFIFSSDYFRKFTDKPGGLLTYAGNFLTQFYFSPVAGALIISVLLVLTGLLLNGVLRLMNVRSSLSCPFILLPSVALMLLQTRYDFHAWHILGFIFALSWFLLTAASGKSLFQFILICLFPILFYVVGSFSMIYIGLYLTFSFLYGKGSLRYIKPVVLLVVSAITFFLFRDLVFYQPSGRLLLFPLFINETSKLTFFISIVSVFVVILPLISWLAVKVGSEIKPDSRLPVISISVLLAVAVFVLFRSYDPNTDTVMKFENKASSCDWDGVIGDQEKIASSNIVVQYYYNLALSEKGELCSRMFFGKQSSGSLALTLSREDEYGTRAMYFYYTIGLSGEAHRLAYEQMVQHGYRPENLRMLIRTELIKGNFRIAERYINVLNKTLHYKKWALKYKKMLYRADLVNTDPELGSKIRLLPKKDFYVQTDDFKNLELLLQDNADNRIAFEYKIARLLLEKDLMEIGKEVKKLRSFGYAHIPRHIEEAIVSLVNVTKEFPDMGGLTISRDTDQRFLHYFSDLKSIKGNRKQIESQIKKVDRNTFWFYLQFGVLKSNVFKNGQDDNGIY
jgi:hypothetical protein